MPMTYVVRQRRCGPGVLRRVAKEAGVSGEHVSRVFRESWTPLTMRGWRTAQWIRALIAAEMGLPVGEVFPPMPPPVPRPRDAVALVHEAPDTAALPKAA